MYNRYRIFNLLPKYKAKQFRRTVIKNTAVLIHTKVLDKNVMLSTMLGFLLTIMSMLHFLFACFILFSFSLGVPGKSDSITSETQKV